MITVMTNGMKSVYMYVETYKTTTYVNKINCNQRNATCILDDIDTIHE